MTPAAVLWWPEALHHVADDPEGLADFAYVVLEELVDHRVVLMAWPWPWADPSGRLFWPATTDQAQVATIDQELLRYQLYRPSRVQRLPRLGDVFAVSRLGAGWGEEGLVRDVRTLVDGPLYDISADAREAAKLAYQGAVATVREPGLADEEDRGLLARAGHRRGSLKARQLKLSPPPERRG